MKHQQIEYKKVERDPCAPIVLQAIKGGPALLIERDDFAVNHRLIWH
jgi:hypothetical protein